MRNPSSSSSSAGGKSKTTTPCCSKVGIKRGPWTPEEDEVLANFVKKEGEGQWRTLPKKAGLLRCGKSCRLRWMNYLRPSVKRGRIAPDEEDLILRLHRLLGNRWSLIAGRIPGRTDNEIKNYWNTHLSKKLISQGIDPRTHKPLNPNPNSPKIPQDSGPKSAPLEETGRPYRVIATKVSRNFSMMTYQDDEQCQNPITNEWPGCESLVMGLQNAEEQSNAAYFIENGNANEDIFTSFLDSLINENDNLFINHHQQQQQQQLQLQKQQHQQQLDVIEPSVRPINVSAPQAFNNAGAWEGGVLSSMAALGDEDVALN